MTLKLLNTDLSTLPYQRASEGLAAYLMVFLENTIPSECVSEYASFKSVYTSKSTSTLCLWLSVHLYVDLKNRYLLRANSSLGVSPFAKTMEVYVSHMYLASSMASVLAWIASHQWAMRICCKASQASFCIWKRQWSVWHWGNCVWLWAAWNWTYPWLVP